MSPPSSRQRALPGILGGLGPLAHIEFEHRLLQHSRRRGASCDQEHPAWILLSATATPDRTKSLLGQGRDCSTDILQNAKCLEAMGASFMLVICNTAHAFHPSIQSQLNIPWLHMMDETAEHIARNFPSIQRVGILATDGTIRTGIYTQSLLSVDVSPIFPEIGSSIQQRVMQAIYDPDWGIKSSGTWISDIALNELHSAVDWLAEQGTQLVVAGCTEISVGLSRCPNLALNWIDPLDVMANLTLDLAYGLRPLDSVLVA